MTAVIEGTLEVQPSTGCYGVFLNDSEESFQPVVWPFGTRFGSDGEVIASDDLVVQVGSLFEGVGGELPTTEGVNDECPSSFMIVIGPFPDS